MKIKPCEFETKIRTRAYETDLLFFGLFDDKNATYENKKLKCPLVKYKDIL